TQRLSESVKPLASGAGERDERQAMSDAVRELEKQNVAGRMREAAQALRGQSETSQQQPGAATDEIARAMDKVAEQLGAASGERDGEAARLSDQLSRAQELRDRVSRLQRSMEDLQANDATGQQANKAGQAAGSSPGQQGGGTAAGREGVERLQRDVQQQMREAQKLAEQMARENPGMQKGGTTPEQWQRSVSAPGTELFKQDVSNWETLKKNLLVALDRTESQLSEQLRARENRERLNAGRHDEVGETYRALVDRYYQSLAAPRPQKSKH
ncbi:MAG: hypothetical protein ACKOEC_17220, partial [Acidimicrobiia bacterium]